MAEVEREPFEGPPARLKFDGRSYMLDADERQGFRGVEVVRAAVHAGAVEHVEKADALLRRALAHAVLPYEVERAINDYLAGGQ